MLSLYESGKLSGLTEVLFIERCINLLKPGGRLGIVLPEGVLNNSQLQSVRDLFESKAKIILITSIPQDVFMASGATVKPSLMFFKKFTEKEDAEYQSIREKAIATVDVKYAVEINVIDEFLSNRANNALEKKVKRSELKSIEKNKCEEMKQIIKAQVDYEIPIAQVQKAGITTTGGECENELDALRDEFEPYRREQKLWEEIDYRCIYEVQDGKLMRKINDKEWEELC